MEFRQLEYFAAVCEELHFTKAADKVGISQPNLSLSIKALEEEIGTPLFDRIGKRIELTNAGAVLQKHARAMLQGRENARREIKDLSNRNGGELSIGALPSELDYRLTPLVIRFFQQYPQIKLKVVSEVDVASLVLNSDIDIGVAVKPVLDPRLVIRPLARDEYGIVVSHEHELVQAESIALAELGTLPVVQYPRGLWGREFVDNWCQQHGVQPNVVVETSSNPSLFLFVRANVGVGIVTRSLMDAIGDNGLRFIPIRDYPPVREMSIIYRSDKYLSHAARAFIHFAEEELKSR